MREMRNRGRATGVRAQGGRTGLKTEEVEERIARETRVQKKVDDERSAVVERVNDVATRERERESPGRDMK